MTFGSEGMQKKVGKKFEEVWRVCLLVDRNITIKRCFLAFSQMEQDDLDTDLEAEASIFVPRHRGELQEVTTHNQLDATKRLV